MKKEQPINFKFLCSNWISWLLFLLILIQFLFSNSVSEFIDSEYTFSPTTTEPSTSRTDGSWVESKIWTDVEDLNAVAVGDVDSSHPGDELVVAGNSNKVTVVYDFGNSWSTETAFVDDWWITSIAIGDVYPVHPGNEIVIVGWSTYVTMVYKDNLTGEWVSDRLYHDYDWLYDVVIGDIDPTCPGNEIVFSGDPRHLRMLSYSNEKKSWINTTIWSNTPSDINVIAIGDFDATHPGNECAVAGVNVNELNLTEILYNNSTGSWEVHNIGKVEKNPLEMVVGDFYSGHPGAELALVSIQRHVMMIHQNSNTGTWVFEKLWQDTESIQDVVIYDILPEHSGNELILVGSSKSMTILTEDTQQPSGWEATNIFTTSATLYGVAIGEFNTFHTGFELALIRQGGDLLKLQYETSDFNLFTPQSKISIPAGSKMNIPLTVIPEGGFSKFVTLSISNSSSLETVGISLDFKPNPYTLPALTELIIIPSQNTIPEKYFINIVGSISSQDGRSSAINKYLNLTLLVLEKTKPSFNMTLTPSTDQIVQDRSKVFKLTVDNINDFNSNIILSIRYFPAGTTYSFDNSKLKPPSSTNLTITTTSNTPVNVYFVMITGMSEDDTEITRSTILKLTVREPEPDFYLTIDPNVLNITINGTGELIINGFSLVGFDGLIDIDFEGLPDKLIFIDTPESFVPTGNTTVKFFAQVGLELKDYEITVIGTSTETELIRTTPFSLNVLPALPGFDITLEPEKKLVADLKETAELQLTVIPEPDFDEQVTITLEGLKYGMTWNEDISPAMIDSQDTFSINISNITRPGDYELTLIVTGNNYSKEHTLKLKVPADADSDADVENGKTTTFLRLDNVVLIIIIIIVFLIILLMLYKFTRRLPARMEKPEEPRIESKHKKKKSKSKK